MTTEPASRNATGGFEDESLDELRDFFDTASIGLHWVGPEGTILRANAADYGLLGYAADEYIGHDIREFHADAEVIADILARVQRGERLRDYPARLIAKDGSLRHVLIDSSALFRDGRFVHSRCFTRDDSERHAAAAAAEEAEQERAVTQRRVQTIADALPVLIAYIDINRRYRFHNEAYREWFGAGAADVRGRTMEDVLGTEACRVLEPHVHAALGGTRVDFEARVPYRSGGARWVKASYVPDVSATGAVLGFYLTVTDISTLREAERDSARAQSILETAVDAIITIDEHGTIGSVNAAFTRVFGYQASEVIGRNVRMLMPEPYAGEHDSYLERYKRTREPRIIGSGRRVRAARKDGTTFEAWLSVSEVALDGETLYTGIIYDLTALTKAEAALAGSEDRLRRAQQAGRLGTFDFDVVNGVVVWDGVEPLHGLEPGAFGGTFDAYAADIHPEDRERVLTTIGNAIDSGSPTDIEYRVIWPDGSVHWVNGRGRPELDEAGRVLRITGTCQDIDARKRTEEALRESEERYRTLSSTVPALIVTTTPEGVIEHINAAYASYTGLTLEQARDWQRHQVIHPDDLERSMALWTHALTAGEPLQSEFRMRRHDGAYRWFLVHGTPAVNVAGEVTRWVTVSSDIEDRKRAEQRIGERAAQQASVARLGQRALADPDVQALFEAAIGELAHNLGVEFAKVLELQPSGDEVVLRAGVGWPKTLVGSARVSTVDSQVGYVLSQPSPVVTADLRTETRFNGEPLLREHGIISGAATVIYAGAQKWGMLGAYTAQRRDFDADDVTYLQSVANILGQAVDRRFAEIQLAYELELNETITANAAVGLVMLDREDRITFLNPAGERITGYRLDDVRGKSSHETWHYRHADGRPYPVAECPINRASVAGSAMTDHEDVFVRADGTFYNVRCNVAPLRRSGVQIGTLIEVRDITAEKRTDARERFLAEASELLSGTLDPHARLAELARAAAPAIADICVIGLFDRGDLSRIETANASPVERALIDRLQIRGWLPSPGADRTIGELVTSGRSVLVADAGPEYARRCAPDADQERWAAELGVHSMLTVPLVVQGRPNGAMSLVTRGHSSRTLDQDDLALAQEVARRAAIALENARLYEDAERSRALLDTIVRTSPVAIGFWDRDLRCVAVNDALADINGLSTDDTAGRTPADYMPQLWAATEPYFQSALAGEPVLATDVRGGALGPRGDRTWLFSCYPVRVAGDIIGVAAVLVEITQQKQNEDELRRALAAKDEFLGMVSHELKTPITTIYGNAEVLARRGETLEREQRSGAVDDIRNEAQRLHRVIDNLLVLARLERGQEVETEPLLLQRLVQRALDTQRRASPGRTIALDSTAPLLPVLASAEYVEQVMRNLVGNAVKYSPPGEPIEIEIGQEGDAIAVRVLDRGPGVPASELESIFTPFYRSPATSNQAQGFGIGLAVCRRLVEAQGGTIWAARREGGGSEFGFSLPIADDA